ncbi:winged helix-turn-helix transcriptional regulator [Sporosarcina sp. ANT_H38]|uniref:ArsR/SmtB family transcription factor n=1 Tax=Sporosarcina sp. ANT_H38 TaxID=2597358 RepID=UPI0011F33F97|nr:metalloregulator ArsR/SmtB family transcription factor [Sporosarcina sp. ANT_H38]KAA0965658.1 winged helix-turn-helix transcriptional regulator [Sporosarcina sp. ANT_H38]
MLISEEVQLFFKGLANEKRQAIILLFLNKNEVTVNQVAELIGIGQSTASEQLSMLKKAGILNSKKEGKEVLYSPNKNNIVRILQDINSILMKCCN